PAQAGAQGQREAGRRPDAGVRHVGGRRGRLAERARGDRLGAHADGAPPRQPPRLDRGDESDHGEAADLRRLAVDFYHDVLDGKDWAAGVEEIGDPEELRAVLGVVTEQLSEEVRQYTWRTLYPQPLPPAREPSLPDSARVELALGPAPTQVATPMPTPA